MLQDSAFGESISSDEPKPTSAFHSVQHCSLKNSIKSSGLSERRLRSSKPYTFARWYGLPTKDDLNFFIMVVGIGKNETSVLTYHTFLGEIIAYCNISFKDVRYFCSEQECPITGLLVQNDLALKHLHDA